MSTRKSINALLLFTLLVACVDREMLLTQRCERMLPAISDFWKKEGRLPFILAEAGVNGGGGADEIHYNSYNDYYTLSFLLDFDMMKTYYSNKKKWGYGYAPDTFFHKEESNMISQETISSFFPVLIEDFYSYLLQQQILHSKDTLFILCELDSIHISEEKFIVKNDFPQMRGDMLFAMQFPETKEGRLFALITAFRKEDDLDKTGWFVIEYGWTKDKPHLKRITEYDK